jgi:hypothetical protein
LADGSQVSRAPGVQTGNAAIVRQPREEAKKSLERMENHEIERAKSALRVVRW